MNIELRKTKSGQGVFAKVLIPANYPIIEFTGDLFNKSTLNKNSYYIQINNDRYIGPSGKLDDYINHSCDPNCYVHIAGNRAFLYSFYIIKPNMQLTFDYSITSTDSLEDWHMKCTCDSFKCRDIISGFSYLPQDIKQFYIKNNMVPKYILKANK